MQQFLKSHFTTLLIFLSWLLVGMYSVLAAYVVIGLTILALWRKNRFFEIFLGFIFITVLSDHLGHETDFAKTFKNIYMVVLAVIPVFSRRQFRPFNRLYLYFSPFLLIGLLVLFRSPEPILSAQKLLSYALLLFAVPQFLNYSFRKHGSMAVKGLIIFCTFLVFVGLLFYVPFPEIATSHGGRFRAIFGNPNGLGIFLILLLILFLLSREYFKALYSKNEVRFMAAVILVSVLLSGSRTAIIGAMMFLILLRFYRISPLFGFIVFFAGIIIGEVVANNISSILYNIGLSDFFRVESLDEASGRFIAWEFAWDRIQDAFWFGRGFAFDEWIMTRNQTYLNSIGHQGGVHNTYLIFWLNTGLVGLLLYLRAFFLLFLQGAKNTTYALPVMWLVMFSIMLEPWLAASLNPYTVLFLIVLVILTDSLYQPYLRGETATFELPDNYNKLD